MVLGQAELADAKRQLQSSIDASGHLRLDIEDLQRKLKQENELTSNLQTKLLDSVQALEAESAVKDKLTADISDMSREHQVRTSQPCVFDSVPTHQCCVVVYCQARVAELVNELEKMHKDEITLNADIRALVARRTTLVCDL